MSPSLTVRLNIQNKIFASFGIVISLMIAVFVTGLWGLTSMASNTTEIVTKDLVEDVAVRELEVLILEQTATYGDFIITEHEEDLEIIEQESEAVFEHFALLEEEFHGNEELLGLLSEVEHKYDGFMEAGDELLRLVQAHASKEEIIHELELLEAEEVLLEEELEALSKVVEHRIVVAYHSALDSKSLATNLSIGGLVLAIVLTGAMGLMLKRSIVGLVNRVRDTAQDLAGNVLPRLNEVAAAVGAGDLTRIAGIKFRATEVTDVGELGEMTTAMNTIGGEILSVGNGIDAMVEGLRSAIGNVADTAESLTDASRQLEDAATQAGEATQGIAETSQQVAKGADDQSRSVEQTQGSLDEFTAAIAEIATGSADQQVQVSEAMEIVSQVSESADSVAQNAQTTANSATDVNDAAKTGQAMMRDTIEGIRGIETAVGSVSTRISELGNQSAEIGKIIGVIDDIADQTNLLALNAAIEAARAGDQGRGFAVVADEVRQLAERVTEATKEIAGLIEVVQTGVEDSMKATKEGAEQVAAGVELAEKASGALQQIIASVTEVTGQIEQISAGAEEVSASGDEMVRTVESVAGISERNASSAEQMRETGSTVQQAIAGIAAITEQTTASAQEASAGAEEMSAQVEEVVASASTLSDMVGDLKNIVNAFKLNRAPGAGQA
jgi:methyl-accepting chemotaxis protein